MQSKTAPTYNSPDVRASLFLTITSRPASQPENARPDMSNFQIFPNAKNVKSCHLGQCHIQELAAKIAASLQDSLKKNELLHIQLVNSKRPAVRFGARTLLSLLTYGPARWTKGLDVGKQRDRQTPPCFKLPKWPPEYTLACPCQDQHIEMLSCQISNRHLNTCELAAFNVHNQTTTTDTKRPPNMDAIEEYYPWSFGACVNSHRHRHESRWWDRKDEYWDMAR